MIETRETFCRFCHAACPIEVDVEINAGAVTGARVETAVAVRGIPDDPLFEGYTCIKGRQLAGQHHAPDRLRAPLRRDGHGTFRAHRPRQSRDIQFFQIIGDILPRPAKCRSQAR